jgi:hypothetical protein
MSIPTLTAAKASIQWGLAAKIEVRAQGTGSFQSVGRFANLSCVATALSEEGDPSATQIVYANQYDLSFDILGTAKAVEVAAFMCGTAATGLLETDAEIKITFADASTISLGTVSGYPMRLISSWDRGSDDSARVIHVTGTVIEPFTAFSGKLS